MRQADQASSKALELEPGLAESHLARGVALSLAKRYDEAKQGFEQAMRLDPNLFEAPYWYSQMQLSQGNYEEAIRLGDRANLLRPEDYQCLSFVGLALKSLGRQEEQCFITQWCSLLSH